MTAADAALAPLRARLAEVEQERDRLRAALEHYADEEHWPEYEHMTLYGRDSSVGGSGWHTLHNLYAAPDTPPRTKHGWEVAAKALGHVPLSSIPEEDRPPPTPTKLDLVRAERDALRARLERATAAIQRVLDDEESRPGGWGPDVTMLAVLVDALAEAADAAAPEEGT